MSERLRPCTICFDATGTLIEATASVGEIYHRVACEHGVDLPAWRLDDAFRRVMHHAPPRGVTGATREERCRLEVEWWFERVRQTFQATDSTARFDDFRAFAQALFDVYRTNTAWRARAEIPETLARLKRENCFLAVTSNFDHRLPEIIEATDLAFYFDLIEIPCEAAHRKPERAVFERVAQASGQPVGSLIYVGDDPPAVLSAIAAHGLRVFDIREIQEPAVLADLLLNAANPSVPATLPGTARPIDPSTDA